MKYQGIIKLMNGNIEVAVSYYGSRENRQSTLTGWQLEYVEFALYEIQILPFTSAPKKSYQKHRPKTRLKQLQEEAKEGWVKFVADQYDDMKLRLTNKGERYKAFLYGNYNRYMEDIYSSPEFEKERFDSSDIINFQGNRKIVL